jgi:quercetin dioxygenase-like cupin family protein
MPQFADTTFVAPRRKGFFCVSLQIRVIECAPMGEYTPDFYHGDDKMNLQNMKLDNESLAALTAAVGTSYVQGGIKRTVLQKTSYPDGYTINFNLIEVPNGTSASPHTHPGLEITYVLDGEFDLVTEGKPDQRFKPGMSYMVSDSDVHFARVLGDKPIKLLCVFINEQDKPVAKVVGRPEAR